MTPSVNTDDQFFSQFPGGPHSSSQKHDQDNKKPISTSTTREECNNQVNKTFAQQNASSPGSHRGIKPPIPTWDPPKPSKYQDQYDFADLQEVDLLLFDRTDTNGKQQLADQLHEIIKNEGFWVLVNHGIPQEQIDRQFALAQYFFTNYTTEEKLARTVDFANGDYLGYKPPADKKFFGTEDVYTNNELLNIAKFTKDCHFEDKYFKQEFIKVFKDELAEFSRKSFQIVRKLLILFAIILELEDEEYFVKQNLYDDVSDDHYRLMQYHPRSKEDDAKVENTWSRPHTDFGTVTLLYNQLVLGLQIKNHKNGEWQYVKPAPGAIVCNVADTLLFYSNGYFKSTVHRVLRPPEDQIANGKPRIGVFYFARLGEKSIIEVAPSPLLKRLGLYKHVKPISGREYVQKRVADYFKAGSIDKQVGRTFKVGEFAIKDGYE